MIRTIFALIATGMMTTGLLMTALNGGASPGKGVQDDIKAAAGATGRAAKKTGKKIKRGAKKAVNKAADVTEGAAEKVKEKTR